MKDKKQKKIAVVICTRNREKHLIEAIKSLKKIKKPKFKIVVMDSSENVLPKNKQKLVDIYIYKEGGTLSMKRNIAIKIAKKQGFDLMAFTDDDCITTPSWLSELTKFFTDKSFECVTGRTVPFKGYESTEYEKKFSFDKIGKKVKIAKKHFGLQNLWRFGHGNNMAFRTSVFKNVGFFDENLGPDTRGLRADDVDMFYRIYKKGYALAYNPDAVIFHKHLIKKEDMPRIAYANGYASKVVLLKHFDINTFILYLGGIIKLSFKFVFSNSFEKIVNFQLLKGWLGF